MVGAARPLASTVARERRYEKAGPRCGSSRAWAFRAPIRCFGKVDRALGREVGSTAQALRDPQATSWSEVLKILEAVPQHPLRFFLNHYPLGALGGGLTLHLARVPAQQGLLFAQVFEYHLQKHSAFPAGQLAAISCQALGDHLARSGVAPQHAADRLGMPIDSLARRLAGEEELNLGELFALLLLVELSPERFFLEVYGSVPGDPERTERWCELLQALETAALR